MTDISIEGLFNQKQPKRRLFRKPACPECGKSLTKTYICMGRSDTTLVVFTSIFLYSCPCGYKCQTEEYQG
jgi:hypothetical protein